MQRFFSGNFMVALSRLAAFTGVLMERENITRGSGNHPFDEKNTLRAHLDYLVKQMKDVPLSPVIRANLQRLQKDAEDDSAFAVDNRSLMYLTREFSLNLINELGGHLFLLVPEARRHLYTDPEKWFGESVLKSFGDEAGSDFRDCARCLALGQWTASVFHAMRVAEHGLRALADRLQVQFTRPVELENWKNIIDQIEREIRKQEQKPASLAKSAELQFCAEAASQFFYFKEAWRNHVSHSRRTYDEEAAVRVVEHVRDFMIALASASSVASAPSPPTSGP